MIEYRKKIERADLQRERDKLFVFGDNMQRFGMGGQAAEMRNEPNAVGIPTKLRPSMDNNAFFDNSDVSLFMRAAGHQFHLLIQHSGTIVWPKAGIGTGRAQLKQRAPFIWAIIEVLRKELE